MKMKRMFFSMVMTTALLSGSECSYTAESATVGWEAYKTPKKAGVKGIFDGIELKADKADNLTGLLEGAKVTIKTARVNSGNTGRDKTLVESFFSLMISETIEGEITAVNGNVEKGEMTVALKMNGVQHDVPMSYHMEEGNIKAMGYLDMFDFGLEKAHASINKACYDLHSGKTWSDVKISAEIKVKKACR